MASVFNLRGSATVDMSKAERELSRFINKAERTNIRLKGLNTRSFTQPLGRITGAVDEFTNSMEAANARVLAFGASAGVIYAVGRSLKAVAEAAIEVERELTQLNSIFQLSTSSLRTFGDELFNVAKKTGQSFSEVARAATEFSRMGLTATETLKRTKDALILTRLSGLEVEKSVMAITAALNTFNDAALDSTKLINKMANVAAQFAVSERDLAEAFRRVGSSAEAAGVSVDELMGIVTTAQVKTARGGAVIGNSLKTLFTRIQRPRVVEAFEALGIAVRDAHGEMLPAMQTLKNYAKAYQTLSTAQRAQTAELLGGVFQVNVLKAIMSDLTQQYNIYDRALGISNNTTDQAIKRNDALSKTLSHLLNETATNAKKAGAALGELTLSPTIKNVLNATNYILEQMFKSAESNDVGAKVGKGILEGIGKILSGPGLAMAGLLIAKLTVQFAKFTGAAVATITGMNSAAKQQAQLQTMIADMMMKQPDLIRRAVKGEKEEALVVRQILDTIKMKNAELLKTERIAARVAAAQRAGGFGGVRIKASGHVPNFAVTPREARMERSAAARAGYNAGSIRERHIPNYGRVVYNSREKIKHFPGFSQPAIMPPSSSPAGSSYAKAFGAAHGFNPYTPNFAALPSPSAFLKDGGTLGALYGAVKSGQVSSINVQKGYGGRDSTFINRMTARAKREGARGKVKGVSNAVPVDGSQYLMLVSQRRGPSIETMITKPRKSAKDQTRYAVSFPTAGMVGGKIPPGQEFEPKAKRYLGETLAKLADHMGLPKAMGYSGINAGTKTGVGFAERVMAQSNLPQTLGNLFDGLIREAVITSGDARRPAGPGNTTFDITGDGRSALDRLGLFTSKAGTKNAAELKLNYSADSLRKMRDKVLKHTSKGKVKTDFYGAGGFVPNFAEGGGIGAAISREIASGAPLSSIRVGSHASLRTGGNPMGLAVTNTIDEGPSGSVSVGINRSRKAGINPKFHGMGEGLIPNFVGTTLFGGKRVGLTAVEMDKFIDGLRRMARAEKVNAKEMEALIQKSRKQKGATTVLTQAMDKAAKAGTKFAADAAAAGNKTKAAAGAVVGGGAANAARAGATAGMMSKIGERWQGGGMMALMMMPMLTQSLAQFKDTSTKQGRIDKASIEGWGETAMWAGMGGMLGPMGALAGGTAGMMMRKSKMQEAATSEIKQMTDALERFKESAKEVTSGVNGLLQGMQKYNALLATGGSGEEMAIVKSQMAESLEKIPEKYRDQVQQAMATGDDAKMQILVTKIQQDVNRLVTIQETLAAFQADLESKRTLSNVIKDKQGGTGPMDYARAFLGIEKGSGIGGWVKAIGREVAIGAALAVTTGGIGTAARVGQLGYRAVKAKRAVSVTKLARGAQRSKKGLMGGTAAGGFGKTMAMGAGGAALIGGAMRYGDLMDERVNLQGRIYDQDTASGKLALERDVKNISTSLGVSGQMSNMTREQRENFLRQMQGAGGVPQIMDALQTNLKGTDPRAFKMLRDNIFGGLEKGKHTKEHDIPVLIEALKKMAKEANVAAMWAEKAAAHQAVLNELRNEELAISKEYEEAIKAAGIALSGAITRVQDLQKSIAEMDHTLGNFQRKTLLNRVRSTSKLAEPFMGEEATRVSEYTIKDLELANKTITKMQKIQLKSQSSFLENLSKRLVTVNDQINNLAISQQATNKAISTTDIVKIGKAGAQRDALLEIFEEASDMFRAGEDQEDIEDHLKKMLINNTELQTIMGGQGLLQTQILDQLRTSAEKANQDRAKALQAHQMELAELRIQSELSRKINVQNLELGLLGGAKGYMEGQNIRPTLDRIQRLRGQAGTFGGDLGTITSGRASLQMLDLIQGSYGAEGPDMPKDLIRRAIEGRAVDIQQKSLLTLRNFPELATTPSGKESVTKKLTNLANARQVAEKQIRAQIKDPSLHMQEIRDRIVDLKVLQALSLNTRENEMFTAFDKAIRVNNLNQLVGTVFSGHQALQAVQEASTAHMASSNTAGQQSIHTKLEEIRRALALNENMRQMSQLNKDLFTNMREFIANMEGAIGKESLQNLGQFVPGGKIKSPEDLSNAMRQYNILKGKRGAKQRGQIGTYIPSNQFTYGAGLGAIGETTAGAHSEEAFLAAMTSMAKGPVTMDSLWNLGGKKQVHGRERTLETLAGAAFQTNRVKRGTPGAKDPRAMLKFLATMDTAAVAEEQGVPEEGLKALKADALQRWNRVNARLPGQVNLGQNDRSSAFQSLPTTGRASMFMGNLNMGAPAFMNIGRMALGQAGLPNIRDMQKNKAGLEWDERWLRRGEEGAGHQGRGLQAGFDLGTAGSMMPAGNGPGDFPTKANLPDTLEAEYKTIDGQSYAYNIKYKGKKRSGTRLSPGGQPPQKLNYIKDTPIGYQDMPLLKELGVGDVRVTPHQLKAQAERYRKMAHIFGDVRAFGGPAAQRGWVPREKWGEGKDGVRDMSRATAVEYGWKGAEVDGSPVDVVGAKKARLYYMQLMAQASQLEAAAAKLKDPNANINLSAQPNRQLPAAEQKLVDNTKGAAEALHKNQRAVDAHTYAVKKDKEIQDGITEGKKQMKHLQDGAVLNSKGQWVPAAQFSGQGTGQTPIRRNAYAWNMGQSAALSPQGYASSLWSQAMMQDPNKRSITYKGGHGVAEKIKLSDMQGKKADELTKVLNVAIEKHGEVVDGLKEKMLHAKEDLEWLIHQGIEEDDPDYKLAFNNYLTALDNLNNSESAVFKNKAQGILKLIKLLADLSPEAAKALASQTPAEQAAAAWRGGGAKRTGKSIYGHSVEKLNRAKSAISTLPKSITDMADGPDKIAATRAHQDAKRGEYLDLLRSGKGNTYKTIYDNMAANSDNLERIVQHNELNFLEESARELAESIQDLEVLEKSGRATGDEIRAVADRITSLRIERGNYGLDDSFRSMGSQLRYSESDFYRQVDDSLKVAVTTFRDGTIDAFDAAITGAKDLKASFKDIFQDMTDHLRKTILATFVNRFIFEPIGAGMQGMGRPVTNASGGYIRGYAGGGVVRGGTGYKDDVPAWLNQGEYVIRRGVVQQPGMESFLQSINSGGAMGASRGAYVSQANKTEWVVSGQSQGISADVALADGTPVRSKRGWDVSGIRHNVGNLTGYALDSDNPQNQLRLDRERAYYQHQDSELSNLETWANEYLSYIKQKKANRRSALVNAGISMASGWLMGERLFGGKFYGRGTAGGRMLRGFRNAGRRIAGWGGRGPKAGGRPVNEMEALKHGPDMHPFEPNASGGHSSRNVPALLTGGEFVVDRDVVSNLGRGFFDKMNAGVLSPRKFAEGGLVEAGVGSAGSAVNQPKGGGGEMTNNITVNVNMNGDNAASSVSGGGMNDKQAKGLGDMIQQQVVQTIIKEKRAGGILNR